MKRILLLFTLIVILCCEKSINKDTVNIDNEISKLINNSEKISYLEMIYNLDQNIRDGEGSEIFLKYGQNSSEDLAFGERMDSIDNLNFERIDLYLRTFGYPDKDSVTEIALATPWLVIHHNSNNSKRKKHFKLLYKAYQDKNIDSDQFDLYLRRTYNIEFGEFPRWEGAYKPEDKINWLIKELGLL